MDPMSQPERPPLRRRVADRSAPPLEVVPVTLAEPALVEIVGFAGAEAVVIDAEHGAIGPETMRAMLAHARSAAVAALFRPRSFDAAACRQALDAGAAGILVSHVDTPEQAAAVVAACRYAPLGRREMSLGRAVEYRAQAIPEHVSEANERELLVVMIESVEGLGNADRIAAVPGIDVIHVGVADLSHAMGRTFQYAHPEVDAAVERIVEAARRCGLASGYPTADPARAAFWAGRGVRFFEADTPDYLLREVYAAQLSRLAEAFSALRAAK
jgi:4-hydroxy-2-oxoheptanedioate aldolase